MILNLLKPFWLQIVKYGTILGGVLVVLFKARQSGKEVQQRKQAIETLRGIKVRDNIQNKVDSASDAAIDRMYQQQIKRD